MFLGCFRLLLDPFSSFITLVRTYVNDLPVDVICNIAIYADDTTLYSKFDQASDLWQQLELASELEFDLRDNCGLGQEEAC